MATNLNKSILRGPIAGGAVKAAPQRSTLPAKPGQGHPIGDVRRLGQAENPSNDDNGDVRKKV
ncbi:MAG: hypothetical protein ACXW6V_02055 [Candidatus Binatia bacterium]